MAPRKVVPLYLQINRPLREYFNRLVKAQLEALAKKFTLIKKYVLTLIIMTFISSFKFNA